MEPWFIIIVSICICSLLKSLFNLLSPANPTKKITNNLPPGPSTISLIANILCLRKSFNDILKNLYAKYGPIFTLHIGFQPTIFVASPTLAHQALVQNGTIFSDRPPPRATDRIYNSNQHSITSSFYGPTWRYLRRNLTSQILQPSRLKSYSHAYKWVLEILINDLKSHSKSGNPVRLVDHFQCAIYALSIFICFGKKLEEKQVKEIESLQLRVLHKVTGFSIINLWPTVGKILFRKQWEAHLQLRKEQDDVYIPLIRERKKMKQEKNKADTDECNIAYVDTLFDLQLPDEKRKLEEGEMVSMCSEFLNGGTHTSTTMLQWTMANLVKYPHIQEKLFVEIKKVVGSGEAVVSEENLQKIPYLKAVILEALRRHPPGYMLMPHAVTEDVMLDGFLIPKSSTVIFMLGEMGWDPKVWEGPMAFKPERFLSSDDSEAGLFDLTGSKEIKMMPFGAGRRICPGNDLGMFNLEYFVANLVWHFEWRAVEGDDVDLTEKQEVNLVMKNPLKAHISPRTRI